LRVPRPLAAEDLEIQLTQIAMRSETRTSRATASPTSLTVAIALYDVTEWSLRGRVP
jgi:hypothetical protein